MYIHIAKASKQQQHGEAVNCKARSLHSRRNFIGLQSCCWYYCSSRLCRQQQPAYVALPAKGIVYLDNNLPRKPLLRVWSFSCTKKRVDFGSLVMWHHCYQTKYVFQKLCVLFKIKEILSKQQHQSRSNLTNDFPRFVSHQTVPLVCLWYYCCSMTTLPFFQRILHQKHNIMARYTLEQQQCCQQATALPQRGRPSIQQQTNLGKKLTFFSDSASVFRVVPPCHSMMILLTFIGSQAEKEEMNSFTGTVSYWCGHSVLDLVLRGNFQRNKTQRQNQELKSYLSDFGGL